MTLWERTATFHLLWFFSACLSSSNMHRVEVLPTSFDVSGRDKQQSWQNLVRLHSSVDWAFAREDGQTACKNQWRCKGILNEEIPSMCLRGKSLESQPSNCLRIQGGKRRKRGPKPTVFHGVSGVLQHLREKGELPDPITDPGIASGDIPDMHEENDVGTIESEESKEAPVQPKGDDQGIGPRIPTHVLQQLGASSTSNAQLPRDEAPVEEQRPLQQEQAQQQQREQQHQQQQQAKFNQQEYKQQQQQQQEQKQEAWGTPDIPPIPEGTPYARDMNDISKGITAQDAEERGTPTGQNIGGTPSGAVSRPGVGDGMMHPSRARMLEEHEGRRGRDEMPSGLHRMEQMLNEAAEEEGENKTVSVRTYGLEDEVQDEDVDDVIQELCSHIVFVRNLPKAITIDEVKELFERAGKVCLVKLGNRKDTLGTAYVMFDHPDEAKKAVRELMGQRAKDKYLILQLHNPEKMSHIQRQRKKEADERKKIALQQQKDAAERRKRNAEQGDAAQSNEEDAEQSSEGDAKKSSSEEDAEKDDGKPSPNSQKAAKDAKQGVDGGEGDDDAQFVKVKRDRKKRPIIELDVNDEEADKTQFAMYAKEDAFKRAKLYQYSSETFDTDDYEGDE